MRAASSLAVAALVGVCVRALAASLQVLPLASPTAYNESYAPAGESGTLTRSLKRGSNRLVVGLHLGHASGRFRLEELMALVPPQSAGKNFCVKLTTRDARYWSLNLYRRGDAKNALWRLETHSKYAAELSQRYSAEDVAIRVFAAADCQGEGEGPLVAAVPPGADTQDVLVLYLNAAGSRAAVKLLDKDTKPIATATCALAPRDSAIAYSEICEIPLAGLDKARVARLQISLIGSDATKTPILADIELPER
jgi:hypothetical protein